MLHVLGLSDLRGRAVASPGEVEGPRARQECPWSVARGHHAGMLTNVRLNRDIVAACKEQGQ